MSSVLLPFPLLAPALLLLREREKYLWETEELAEGRSRGHLRKVHVDVLDWEPFFQWFIFGMDSEGGQSRGKGYVQSGGTGGGPRNA